MEKIPVYFNIDINNPDELKIYVWLNKNSANQSRESFIKQCLQEQMDMDNYRREFGITKNDLV